MKRHRAKQNSKNEGDGYKINNDTLEGNIALDEELAEEENEQQGSNDSDDSGD